MKKWFCFCLLLLVAANFSNAQFNRNTVLNKQTEDLKFLNWGYFLGLNQYDFKFKYKENAPDILVSKSFSFNVGLIGEMRMNRFFDVRFEPGLHYTTRIIGFPGFDNERDAIRQVPSTYINFPLLLKASTLRFGNLKPFLLAGGSTSLNLGSNEGSKEDNSSGTFRMKKWVYSYELGFGIDFYLQYFKFTPSIRGIFGLTNELVPDDNPNSPWTSNIESMKTRGIFINFTFE